MSALDIDGIEARAADAWSHDDTTETLINTDVPALIDRVRELEATVARVREIVGGAVPIMPNAEAIDFHEALHRALDGEA